MWDTAVEPRMNSFVAFFYGPLYLDVSELADLQELVNISSVRKLDVVWKTCQEQWMIGMDGERERERESEQLEDDEDDDDDVLFNIISFISCQLVQHTHTHTHTCKSFYTISQP